ncbi:MAG TPA: branched-chain amino acid ABC transporter substrate-binding protein [Burkholderiales bacterium]|jgi:branched-chain amino acid transport system substrate-binding protein|nr:branched-chain amino acid ABC transporter substrate-binding protein [Burkholderiales bacterium]
MRNKIGITLAAVAVALAGCGEQQKPAAKSDAKPAAEAPKAPASPATQEVKIGHVAPLTGGIAHLGKDNENGARLAVEEANAAGIKIDGKAVKFTLVAEDDQADPKVGTTVAQKLVDAKVAGVVGHLNSGTSIPASPIYSQAGIPVISGSATNPKLTEQGFKTQFRVVGRDDQQGPAVASYLAANNKPRLVAVVDDSTAYGEGIANEVEKTLKAAGIKTLPREKGTDKTTDWKAILTKLRGRNPDAVFYGGMDATGGPLLKQGRELGMKAVFSFGDGACTDEMAKLAGQAAEGLLCSQAGIPAQAADKKFLEAYKKKFNVDPILYSPFTYDAANLLIAAMQKANSAEPAKYLPELQKISFTGATGPIAFDDKGDRKDAEMTIFTMKGGKIEPIAVIKGGKTIPYAEFLKGGK